MERALKGSTGRVSSEITLQQLCEASAGPAMVRAYFRRRGKLAGNAPAPASIRRHNERDRVYPAESPRYLIPVYLPCACDEVYMREENCGVFRIAGFVDDTGKTPCRLALTLHIGTATAHSAERAKVR